MSAAFASTCALVGGGLVYARVVADAVGPGTTRLLLLAPALCVNVAAPLLVLDPEAEPLFSAIAVANFSWWSNFKLIALAAGRGQLTRPALSAPAFVALAALPVRLADERVERSSRGDSNRDRTRVREHRRADPHTSRDAILGFACKLAALWCCVSVALPALDARQVGERRDAHLGRAALVHARSIQSTKNVTYAVALYAFLGAMFDLGALFAFAACGVRLARHFDLPFLATSFGDFWGARWNLVAGASLRDAVYAPITEGRFFREGEARGRLAREAKEDGASREKRMTKKIVGVFACFAVSGAMHEFVLWALVGRSSESQSNAIGWEWFAFFLSQAPLVSLEYAARKKKTAREKKNPRGAVFFVARRAAQNGAFLVAQLALANALFFPPVARSALDARIVADVRRVLGVQTP